jgi:hypothetical protein
VSIYQDAYNEAWGKSSRRDAELPIDRLRAGTMHVIEAVEVAATQVENEANAPGIRELTRSDLRSHATLLRAAVLALKEHYSRLDA